MVARAMWNASNPINLDSNNMTDTYLCVSLLIHNFFFFQYDEWSKIILILCVLFTISTQLVNTQVPKPKK